ncbi:MAG: GlsB/YeaQ/YmgE family stress response membrane protein [Patescibacteria group bacterium]
MEIMIFWIVCAILAGAIGAMKNRTPLGIILGVLLGFIGVLIILFVPKSGLAQTNTVGSNAPNPTDSTDTRKCPFCAEVVRIEAKICKHCRSDLPEYKVEADETLILKEQLEEKLAREEAEHKREKQLLETYSLGNPLKPEEISFLRKRGTAI